MTAAVMGRHGNSPSRYGVAFGDESRNDTALDRFFAGWENVFCAHRSIETYSREVAEEPNVLDYVFEHVESFTCADDESLSYQNDPFFAYPHFQQHHQEQQQLGNEPHFREFPPDSKDDLSLKRENSLVEQGPNGAPAMLLTTRQRREPGGLMIAKMGQEGDLLDYCFEHVESFVCNTEASTTLGDNDRSFNSRFSNSKGGTPRRNTTNNARRNAREDSDIPRVISTTRKKKKRRNRRKQNYYPDEEDNILLYYRPTTSAQ